MATKPLEELETTACQNKYDIVTPVGKMAEVSEVQQDIAAAAAAAADDDDDFRTPSVICVNNHHGAASTFCADCTKFYCQLCTSSHELFASTRGHELLSLEDMSASELEQATEKPPEPDLVQHNCQACKTSICTTCFMLKGKDHHHHDLMDSAREARKELKQLIDGASAFLVKQGEGLAEMDKEEKRFLADVASAKREVKEAAERIRSIIDDQEKVLIRDLGRNEADAVTKATLVRETAQVSMSRASTLKKDTEKLYHSGRAIDQVVGTPKKVKEIGAQIGTHQQMFWRVHLKHQQIAENSLRLMLGDVSVGSPRDKITLGKHLQSVSLEAYDQGAVVTGMVLSGAVLCLTFRAVPKLFLYDTVRGRAKMCAVPELQNPRGMALANASPGSSNVLVLTDGSDATNGNNGNGKLHFVTVTPELNIAHHRVKRTPVAKPCRVSVSCGTGHLLVGQWDSGQFSVCSGDGDVLSSVSLGHGLHVMCVTQTNDKYAALVLDGDWGGTIKWLDENGLSSHTYGLAEEEQLKKATHMIQVNGTSGGQLIVTDRGHNRLHLVDTSSRRLSQYLLTEADGIREPRCVYLDEGRGRLYVAHGRPGSQEVCVYGWPADTSLTNCELNVELGSFFQCM